MRFCNCCATNELLKWHWNIHLLFTIEQISHEQQDNDRQSALATVPGNLHIYAFINSSLEQQQQQSFFLYYNTKTQN